MIRMRDAADALLKKIRDNEKIEKKMEKNLMNRKLIPLPCI